jgi:putative transposase
MDEAHLLNCARYIALNPVRAGLVAQARAWPWSSVRAHCDGRPDALVMTAPLLSRLGDQINAFFDEDAAAPVQRDLRRSAGTGRPLGSGAWLKAIEAKVGRSLDPPRLGRPPRRAESRDTHAFPRTDEAAARWL